MSIFKLSWLYLTRKKGKPIILAIILSLLGTTLISLISIQSALEKEVIYQQAKTIYLVGKDGGVWPQEAFSAIKESQITENLYGIRESNEKSDLKYVAPEGFNASLLDLSLVAYQDSDKVQAIEEKRLTLVKGRMVTNEDQNKVVLHQDLADLNQLKVGSTFKIKDKEVEVVGLYKPSKEHSWMYENRNIENTVITNEKLMTSLYTTPAYTTMVLKVTDERLVNSIVNSMKQWGVDWSKLDVKTASEFHGEAYKNMVTLYQLVNRIMILVSVFAVTFLIVILKRWVNMRRRETGVLLALGQTKLEIISRYLIEVGVVSLVSFAVSILLGIFLGQALFTSLLSQVNGGIVSSAVQESQLYMENFKNISVSIGIGDVILLYLIGLAICFIAVVLSTYSIIRLKPKEILSMMS